MMKEVEVAKEMEDDDSGNEDEEGRTPHSFEFSGARNRCHLGLSYLPPEVKSFYQYILVYLLHIFYLKASTLYSHLFASVSCIVIYLRASLVFMFI